MSAARTAGSSDYFSFGSYTLQQLEDAEQKGFPRISLSPEQLADPGFWEGLWNSLRPIANTSAEWLT